MKRVAWVTGGASGMGAAIALSLAKSGVDIAVSSLATDHPRSVESNQNAYRPSPGEVEGVISSARQYGVTAESYPMDVSNFEEVVAAAGAITSRFGRIDILVNAAGTGARQTIVGHSDELWSNVLATNLSGPFYTIRCCLPGMVQRGWGRIVNIASTAARYGNIRQSAYCASKSGLLGLTRCVALEGARHGVTCNSVSPGFVPTSNNALALTHLAQITSENRSVDEIRADIAKTYPMGRLVDVEEIAATVAFLCSGAASAVTAENITVSGGATW
jgi:NAD(P)-dependent dehydrogenase (short-subunit alcohol dehydrogenase family)